MTVTYVNLVGNSETFDKTLSKAYENAWSITNVGEDEKPRFRNATDKNVDFSWPRTAGNREIHFNTDDSDVEIPEELANGNTWKGMKTIVFVDIFCRDSNQLKKYIKEFNRITWDVLRPDSVNRIKKDNEPTENSHIDHFENYNIRFIKERIQKSEDNSKQAHASGEIIIKWYQVRT